jgi:transcriptional regulator with XRE-family HTH domain
MDQRPTMPERLTAEERRHAAQLSRQRWADEVRQALAEQRLTVHAAARLAGISPGALQAWLYQDVEPSPRSMAALASVLGRRHLYLLELLGWLPVELSELPLRLEASTRLQESLAEAQRWVQASTSAVAFSGGLIASTLLERGGEWEVVLRQSYQGRQYRQYPYATYVAFVHLDKLDPNQPSTQVPDTIGDRREIESLIGYELQRANATWLATERTSAWPWVKRPDLVLQVPLLRAGRPRGLQPNLVVPPSVCVAGVPFAGGPEVAALLATTLDWAFSSLDGIARERFGAPPSSPEATQAQSEIARRLLAEPNRAGRLLVWSYDSAEAIVDTFREARPDLPLVIFLKASDALLEYAGDRLGDDWVAVQLETAQNTIKRVLGRREDPKTWLALDVPELALDSDGLHDFDTFFDIYVELAFQAADWLHKEHEGPSLDDAPGMLAELWRSSRRD